MPHALTDANKAWRPVKEKAEGENCVQAIVQLVDGLSKSIAHLPIYCPSPKRLDAKILPLVDYFITLSTIAD